VPRPAGVITVIGDFTFDPTTKALDAVDLDVTGGPQPGTYNHTQPIEGFAAAISASIPGSDMDLVMSFKNDLATVPDPVSKVLFLFPNGMVREDIEAPIPQMISAPTRFDAQKGIGIRRSPLVMVA
jgi:hypothetical protein